MTKFIFGMFAGILITLLGLGVWLFHFSHRYAQVNLKTAKPIVLRSKTLSIGKIPAGYPVVAPKRSDTASFDVGRWVFVPVLFTDGQIYNEGLDRADEAWSPWEEEAIVAFKDSE